MGSGTFGSKKCGKWDFQDAVSPPVPPPLNICIEGFLIIGLNRCKGKYYIDIDLDIDLSAYFITHCEKEFPLF